MLDNNIPDLRGKTALVTGASRGIGRAIALGFGKAGAAVIVHGKSDSDELDKVCKIINASGGHSEKLFFDLADTSKISAQLCALHRSIDIVVLNASVENREDLYEIDPENVTAQFTCNFLSLVEIVKTLTPLMCQRGWGRIIGIGSIQEVHANPTLAVYAALKSAQTHFLKTLALQTASHGVTVNTIAPGVILTQRNEAVLADIDFCKAIEERIPAGRIGKPQDCVGATLFLSSVQADYITGVWLPVDGGFHAA
jgi:glucose 1-dehydrogenase